MKTKKFIKEIIWETKNIKAKMNERIRHLGTDIFLRWRIEFDVRFINYNVAILINWTLYFIANLYRNWSLNFPNLFDFPLSFKFVYNSWNCLISCFSGLKLKIGIYSDKMCIFWHGNVDKRFNRRLAYYNYVYKFLFYADVFVHN